MNERRRDDTVKSSDNEISFFNFNVRGLLPKLGDPDFVDYVCSHDVIIFTETYLLIDFDHSTKFDDYMCIQKCGWKLSQGGRP